MLNYHDEIVGDLSAVHRVDEWRELTLPRFLLLVRHLIQHGGSSLRRQLTADVARENEEAQQGGDGDALIRCDQVNLADF